MRYRNKGYVIEFELKDGYSIYCSYNFIKENNKYGVNLYLTRNDIDFLDKIDTYYLEGDKGTIKTVIVKFVEEKYNEGFFNYYIERIVYMLKCFDKGNEMFECVRLYEEK